tara:strand:+ start:1424 stop:2467 length:1044 start_codon:yes stop_codon:yes gene_type:complete
MSRIYCHYKLPLFIRKNVREGISGAKRPCAESILEPIKKRCSVIDTPNIEYPSAKNRLWIHCYPCDHWYCPKHASSKNDIQHDNCLIAAQRRTERGSIESKRNKSKDKSRSSKERSKERTSKPKSKSRSSKSAHKNISANLVQPVRKKSFIISKARVISPLYEKEIVGDTEYREISVLTLAKENPPLIEDSPIMRTFSTQTDEEISDTETEAMNSVHSLNTLNALYLELQSNYDTLHSKYTILKTLGPALNSAHKRKISELHSENSTLISEKKELSTDIQRLLDQIEKLSGIIADNLHHIQDIESQRDALTEWFPNSILRKLILEKISVTAPKLEELSPTRNPLFNH